jgi:hypothetical protein
LRCEGDVVRRYSHRLPLDLRLNETILSEMSSFVDGRTERFSRRGGFVNRCIVDRLSQCNVDGRERRWRPSVRTARFRVAREGKATEHRRTVFAFAVCTSKNGSRGVKGGGSISRLFGEIKVVEGVHWRKGDGSAGVEVATVTAFEVAEVVFVVGGGGGDKVGVERRGEGGLETAVRGGR